MRFGIFYELQLPRPWADGSELELVQQALEQVELADRLGIDYVWEVEHHFLEEYSHSSAPEVFLAAASQRTSRIRLGHGVVLTAPRFNHPARVAERVAMLDLLSGGRVELGTGESSSAAELDAFGVDFFTKREQWEEGLRVAVRCMTEAPFTGHEGPHLSMPPRNVVPKPLQRPHPPLWVACSRRDTILLAAEKGMGALCFDFVDPERARQWVADYETALTERAVPIGLAVNPQVACVTSMMCHPDERRALEMGLEGANFFGYSLGHYYVFGEHHPGSTDVWREFHQHRDSQGYAASVELALQQETLGARIAEGNKAGLRGAIGTPDQVRDFLRRYEDAGVDQVIFAMQTGRSRHEDVMASLELLAREVLPEFAERDEKLRAAKAKRLEPAVEAALERREAWLAENPPPALPDDFVVRAIPRQMVELADNDDGRELLAEIADETAAGTIDLADRLG